MQSFADSSLFVKKLENDLPILLLYVDDIIHTGINSSLVDSLIKDLRKEFNIKHLGTLSYFLGLQVSYTNLGILLTRPNIPLTC